MTKRLDSAESKTLECILKLNLKLMHVRDLFRLIETDGLNLPADTRLLWGPRPGSRPPTRPSPRWSTTCSTANTHEPTARQRWRATPQHEGTDMTTEPAPDGPPTGLNIPAPADNRPDAGPSTETPREMAARLSKNYPSGPPMSAADRRSAAVDAAVESGGYVDHADYVAALRLKASGRADSLTLNRLANTPADISILANRPG